MKIDWGLLFNSTLTMVIVFMLLNIFGVVSPFPAASGELFPVLLNVAAVIIVAALVVALIVGSARQKFVGEVMKRVDNQVYDTLPLSDYTVSKPIRNLGNAINSLFGEALEKQTQVAFASLAAFPNKGFGRDFESIPGQSILLGCG